MHTSLDPFAHTIIHPKQKDPTNWILASLFSMLVAGYPIAASVALWFAENSRAVTVPYRASVFLLSLTCFGIAIFSRKASFYRGPIWNYFVAFWLTVLWRLMHDFTVVHLDTKTPASDYFFYAFAICFVSTLPFFVLPNNKTLIAASKIALWLPTAALTLVVLAAYSDINDISGQSVRLEFPTFTSVEFGQLGAYVALIWLSTFITKRHVDLTSFSNIAYATIRITAIVGGFIVMFLTASKGPAISILICIPLLLIVPKAEAEKRLIRGSAVLLCILTLVSLAYFVENNTPFNPISRFTKASLEDPSTYEHVQMLQDAVDEFFAHPLLGNAAVETNSGTYPHNIFVEAFMALGLVGGVPFSIILGYSVICALRVLYNCADYAWIAILYIQTTIVSMFSGGVYIDDQWWGLAIACICLHLATAEKRESVQLRLSSNASFVPVR